MECLTLALPKGRLLEPSLKLLAAAGLETPDLDAGARTLLAQDKSGAFRFLVARPADVPTYVEHGAADVGLVGKDVLLESGRPLPELLDLGFGRCRFALAAPRAAVEKGLDPSRLHLRVATKYPRVTEEFFRRRGLLAEIIVLHGALELAPRVGLAEMIVDLVSTGRTLRENDLVEVAEIARASARLVANPASHCLRAATIQALVDRLRATLATGGDWE